MSNSKTSNATSAKSTLFPVIPKSAESFVAFLFWHSMFLTSTTPLSRMISKSWDGKLIIPTILNAVGIPQLLLGRPAIDTYLAYAPSPKTDRAFGPHAFFGLIWLIAAYMHICHRRRFQSKTGKRALGMFTVLAFLGHQICSFRCLIINPMNQHVLPWMMLLTNVTVATGYFILGMYALVKKDIKAHKAAMMRCFLYSIEGAGTIRTVGAIMHLFGLGPTFCQQLVGGCAAQCVFSYVHRLIWIRLLTVYYNGIYAKIRGDEKSWASFKNNTIFVVALSAFLMAFFIFADEPEQFFDSIFAPNGNRTIAVVVAFSVCLVTILNPDDALLLNLVKPADSASKLTATVTKKSDSLPSREEFQRETSRRMLNGSLTKRVRTAAAA